MPAKKRAHGEDSAPTSEPRRRSNRISSTPKKSNYFEDADDKGSESDPDGKPSARHLEIGARHKRTRVNEITDHYESHSESAVDDDEGGDDDSSDEGSGSPRVTFVPLPKLRDTGGIEYEDGKLHRNTMAFLKDLKANNKRSWLKLHDQEYRRALKDFESFIESLTESIIEADETIPELPLKDVIFRIYRDIRFSKDPTPYKPHFSAAWSRTGRKGPYACYYIHMEPGSCFVGGGLWHPDGNSLQKIRQSIDERPHRIRRVLMNPAFRKTFLPKAKSDEKSVLLAFAESNKENALKTKPKGYNPEHRDLELLKLRNFTVGKKFEDVDFTREDTQQKIMAAIIPMVEYVTFLNNVVMPDPDFDDDSDEEDGSAGTDGDA